MSNFKMIFLGNTSFIITDGKTTILLDPMYTRPSLLKILLTKIKSDKNIVEKVFKENNINKIDYIFLSHTHYDHCLDVNNVIDLFDSKIYGSNSINFLVNKIENINIFKAYQEYQLGDFKILVLPAIHSPKTILVNDIGKEITKPIKEKCRYTKYIEGGCYNFYITYNDKSLLFYPSCNISNIDLSCYKCDYFLFGVGPMGDKKISWMKDVWDSTILKTNPKVIIPVHFDNFFKTLDKFEVMPDRIGKTSRAVNFINEHFDDVKWLKYKDIVEV